MHLAHNQVLHAGCENKVDFVRTLAGGLNPSICLFCGLWIALNLIPSYYKGKGMTFLSHLALLIFTLQSLQLCLQSMRISWYQCTLKLQLGFSIINLVTRVSPNLRFSLNPHYTFNSFTITGWKACEGSSKLLSPSGAGCICWVNSYRSDNLYLLLEFGHLP